MTTAQVIAVAAFERQHGRALHVPPGPRRDRLLRWAGYGAVVVQSDAAYMEPEVLVVEGDGRGELVDSRPRLLGG